MRFAADDTAPVVNDSGLLGLHLEKADLMHLAQTALFGVIGVLALLLVLRPMVLRLTTLNVAGALSAAARHWRSSVAARPVGHPPSLIWEHCRWSGRRRVCWKTRAW